MSAPPLSIYVHVPFCASRCGYCDFNTYTATELPAAVSRETFHQVLIREIRSLASAYDGRSVTTIFIGGGTPTLIGSAALGAILQAVAESFALAPEAEVTTEANPDAVDEVMLEQLRAAGFTRISLGMQSAAKGVLAVLDRTHTPGRSAEMARAARRAGFEHVNLDLIYGTPGERDEDLRDSLDAVIDAHVDHVSAYALIVEAGTGLARRIDRGEIARPDDDVAAHRYLIIDEVLAAAGFGWYEVSNWARPGGECRHNRAYWSGADWLGIGPGAHSHVAGRRWWNAKHPSGYAEALGAGRSPIAGWEDLDAQQRRIERIMLDVRTRDGLALAEVGQRPDDPAVQALLEDGLIEPGPLASGGLVLSQRGRLLADLVIRALVG